jgi:hypothetical protein
MIDFSKLKTGQRFTYKNREYLKVPEIKKSCCEIQSNAVDLENNKNVLFEYKKKVEEIK